MEHIQYDHILVRYGELSTKGKNRKDFIKKLTDNIRASLSAYDKLTYERTFDRLYIHLHGTQPEEICTILKEIFGLSSFSLCLKIRSELDAIVETGFQVAMERGQGTFKVETRRHDKKFPLISDQINRAVATKILKGSEMKVDVHHPDLRIGIEVREEFTYVMADTVKGAGGYPVGMGGKALLMLSGGIDSPVAGYLTMKRGVEIECIHYASPPYTSSSAQKKVLDLAGIISKYQGRIKVHIIPFTDLQLAIYKHCDESYAITIMRRMMYRIAQRVAQKYKCLAIVNGESIGQVASQTLESMQTINQVIEMPVIRPVVTYDKLEIIDLARRINTYETSILPFEDCCTIFTPKNPVTKPHPEKAEKMEVGWDFETLIDECIEKMETVIVTPTTSQEDDLF